MSNVFPPSLPSVSLFELSAAGQRAASPLPGYVQQRARTASAWAEGRVAWVFTEAERAVFEAWFRDDLLRGSAWALIKLPITPDSPPCYSAVRFPNGYATPILADEFWRVDAEIEVRDRFECALEPPNRPVVWVPDGPWVMSNGDKTASIGSLSNPFPHTYFNLQGSRYQSGGKVYWEVQLNDTSSSANSVGWCGFVTASGYRFACIYSGTILQSTGARPDIYALPSTNPYAGATSWGGPRTLRFAVDVDAGQLWVGNESGWLVWTGSVAPNPATGTEPLPLLNPLTEPIRPEIYHLPNFPTFTCTLRSAASEMGYAIPAGFRAIGGP